ncbi:MAG: hypothetical protein GF310_07055 [candidate division Zixibacteria bacterium]|nr:hypothetical protein [candidate division Zixibacteria bacterium]
MIKEISLAQHPLSPNEERILQVWSDTSLQVQIECFGSPPDPPILQPCSTCGSFAVESGQPFTFKVPDEIFRMKNGKLHIKITDSSGDKREYKLPAGKFAVSGE